MKFLEKKECPETNIQQNFDTKEFLGRWYEMYRPKKQPFQSGECNNANYSLRDDGLLRVINAQRYINYPGKIGSDTTPDLSTNTAQGFASGVVQINKPG